MKALALLATVILSVPAVSEARDKRVIIVGGSGCAPRYTSHSHCYSYSRPSYSYYRPYVSYSSQRCYPSYRTYSSYSYVPSVSFSYVSAPRTYSRPVPAYDYDYDSSDSLERDVQRALKRRGYYDGSIDGDIGPSSRSAIRAFQYDRGLSPTGRIDSTLLRALGV